jgi:hypothetical protein
VIADAPTYSNAADLILPDHPKDLILWPVYPLLFQFIEWRSGVLAPEPLLEAVKQITPRSLLIISTGLGMEMQQAQHYYERAAQPKVLVEYSRQPALLRAGKSSAAVRTKPSCSFSMKHF